MIVRPQSGRDFCFSGWGGGGNSPPSAGIPRQVWYAVTKAVRKALKHWAAGLAWLVALVLCQLVLAKINLDRSDHCVIVAVSLRGLVQCCVMSHHAIAGIKKEPGSGYPELRALLFSHILPRRDYYSQRNARMMYPIIDNRPMMAMVRLPQLSALRTVTNASNRQ